MIEIINNALSDPLIQKFIILILGVFLIIIISRVIKHTIRKHVKVSGSRYRGRKLISFLSYILIILLAAIIFSDQLGGITVALGVAGAGIAFALQEVIISVAGWFAISFAHFYKIGDRIQLGGIKGDVIDISILRTTLMEIGNWVDGDLYNGRVVRIANSFVFKEPVFNYSGDFPFLWDELTLPIRYGSDLNKTKKILSQAAHEVLGDYTASVKAAWAKLVERYVLEDARVEPMVSLAADENWVTFTVRYVVEFKKRRGTKDMLYSKILENIRRNKKTITIASAAQEITIRRKNGG